MSLKRQALSIGIVMLGLCLTTAAQAKKFSVIGGGGQTHIGNGLMLPIQQAATPGQTGTVFPPLQIPIVPGATVTGTTVKPLTVMGTKSAYQRTLKIPAGVLKKNAQQTTVGVKFSNPTLYAVGTNASYTWPAAPATLSTGAVGPTFVSNLGGTLTYSNALNNRFGGPAQFRIVPQLGAGLVPTQAITIYGKPKTETTASPPCTHPAFAGSDGNCVSSLLAALPVTGLFGVGGATGTTVNTPGAKVAGKNIAVLKVGTNPSGTILAAVRVLTNPLVPTNMAVSQPGPWTTGQVIISHPSGAGAGEVFVLSGKDSRTALGGGTIQLVSGAVSNRWYTGPNANRGWVQLTLAGPGVSATPPLALVAGAGLLVLIAGYVVRRRHLAA